MNLLNIVKNLLYLTQTEYGYEHSAITTDEIFASKQLFEVLKSFKDSYFSELHSYDTLELADEYDELTDDEESNDKYEETTDQGEDSDNEADDYNENEHCDIKNHFTLEEMENIIEWVDEHPNARFATISHRFRKIKSMKYISRFRKYIENTGTKLEKLKQIKEFMFNEFYLKRTIEKEAVHDNDLELYAIQKARELDWDTFKASKSFINTFKRENGISSRRYNKLVTRIKSNRKVCSLNGNKLLLAVKKYILSNLHNILDARNWVESKRTLISKYSSDQILNSDHCSFQKEYVSPRTLSFTGERTTEVAIKKKHNVTHTYTVQPVTSAAGRLLNKFLLILQEKDDEFGKIVEKNMIIPPNVIVQASKSGKSTAAKHYIFLNDVLRPFVHKKFLLFLDSWTIQTDQNKFRKVFPHQDSQLLIFPQGSTGTWTSPDDSHFCSRIAKLLMHLVYNFGRKILVLQFTYQKILNLIYYRMKYFLLRGDFYKLDF